MTSFRQWQANRRNAVKSTGPTTEAGKQRSRANALRHGLCAETVVGALEDAEDYQAFEAAIIADYDAQSAVERELVLRLASALWRLRRATSMETGLFEIEADHLGAVAAVPQLRPPSREAIHSLFRENGAAESVRRGDTLESSGSGGDEFAVDPSWHLAQCYLRLANVPTYPLDRLARYEHTLWRQVAQILFALNNLHRRKPKEGGFRISRHTRFAAYAPDRELEGD